MPSMRVANLAVLPVLLMLACGGGDASMPPNTTVPAPASATAPRPAPSPAARTPLGAVSLQRVFTALSFVRATGMYELPDGSGRFLVTEQRGRILIFEGRDNVAQAGVFMDITDRVNSSGNEEGLLGLAFDPDFQRTGAFFLNYTAQNPRRTVIARFIASASRASADPGVSQIILEVGQPFANHNGGQIAFGPDGFLYIGMGDGGSGNDPGNRAQNLNELLGKILRIDPDGATQANNYLIPADNPFVGQAGARGEVWAYGLRNPWRFSFDTVTGDLWAGDVGQNAREEIDLIRKGQNYGWPQVEGSQCNAARAANCDRAASVAPVIDYPTSGGNCSVTGGYVYRKGDIAAIDGAYVYADYCSGMIFALRYNGSEVTERAQIADAPFRIATFAQDRAGSLYAIAHGEAGENAGIYRLTAP